MNRFIHGLKLLLIFLLLFQHWSSRGEGTKQIYPLGWGNFMFCVSHDPARNQFALYGCPETERLNIQIKNPGEIIYWGLNAGTSTTGFNFQIRDPKDHIVVPQTQIPTAGTGYINDLIEARTGPGTIFPGGYIPYDYIALDTGAYYLEFDFTTTEENITYLDITVANPADTSEIPGRVWSKGWQLSSTGGDPQYGAVMYVYTDQRICTAIDFNGMRPYTFDISCNATGCAQTGNFVQDRKSRTGRHLYPQFKIFLNMPDSNAFPSGVLGHIDSTAVDSHCNGRVDFTVWASSSGSAEILLDIYPPNGFNAGDVVLNLPVLPGITGNQVMWDGLDGFGQPVANGEKINVGVSYLNGLTHLPIYDVEWNFSYNPWWTGYKVSLVRPAGQQPVIYWNDSLCGGNANLTGCINPMGCHAWDFNVGDVNTVNTWWYTTSTSATPITLLQKLATNYDTIMIICNGDSVLVNGIYRKLPGTYTSFDTSRLTGCDSNAVVHLTVNPSPAVNLGPDVWICQGQSNTFDAGAGVGYTYRWDDLGLGLMNIATTQTYATSTPGFYKVTVTSLNGCHRADSVHLYINGKPVVTNTPMSRSICSNTTFTLSLTSSNPGTNFSWIPTVISGNVTGATSGSGTTINNFLVNTLSTSGTVQYTITPVSGGCVGNDTIYTVVVHPKPVVTTTPLTYSLCSPGLTAITLTSQVASPVFGWKATGSSGNVIGYSNGGGGIISQSLTNTGFNIENVIYRTAASANGCTGDSVNFTVTLKPMPNLSNVPLNKSQCNNQNTSVVLTSNVPGTLFTWTATPGSANITGQSDQLIPVALISQVLINSSYSDQIVTYHLTPHANGCTGVLVNFVVTVHPTPDLTNTPLKQSQCNSVNTNLLLTSHVTGTLFTWTTTPSSPNVTGYSNNIIPANQISQVLINIGNSVETVTYHITPFANGCTGTVSQFIVTVNPTPDLQVVPSTQTLCSGNQTNIQLQSGYTGTLFSWTATGSSPEVSGYSNGTGNKIQQILNNSGYLAPTVTYSITPSVSGCTGLQKQAIVTVKAIPIVTFQSCIDSVTTINARPFLLKRGIPIGGTYSGPGVNSLTGLFTPASAGTGLKTITYSYTNAAICSATGSLVIEVKTMVPFTCGNNLVDFRDNHSYPTVVIGTKCWMAVDLNHGAMVNSTQMQRDNCMVEKYCYNDDPANCSTLGGLYQWDEVMRYSDVSGDQGLCPSGWHIPSEVEWKTLFDAYISNGFAGSALKYSGFSGFNTLLTGIRFRNSVWKFPSTDLILKSKLYWSSTTNGAFKAWAHGMNEVVDAPDFTPSVSFYPALRSNALAARCVRD